MKNLYLPKETIVKGLVAILLGIVTILKMFGIDLEVTEGDIDTVVLSFVDVITFAILIYKNFVTSKANYAATNKMRWEKKISKLDARGEENE